MKEKICDLHTHSTFSDGTYAPEELVKEAVESGLSAIALTDHNTVAGLTEFTAAAKRFNIECVQGIEFSTDYNGTELHIVGLFLQKRFFGQISDYISFNKKAKERSNVETIERLNAAGYSVDYDEIKANAGKAYINRVQIAEALKMEGYVSSVKEAFSTLLSEKNGFYVPAKKVSALKTISFLDDIGAVSVLAHPLLNLNKDDLLIFLKDAKAVKLDAMETEYSEYDDAAKTFSKAVASEYSLLQSGGSDFHGANKPDIRLGTGKGALNVPYDFYMSLKNRADEKSSAFS